MNQTNIFLIPGAIVIGFALVAAAIFFSDTKATAGVDFNQALNTPEAPAEAAPNTDAIEPVTADDHIKGSFDAPIKIVEYSDFDCPFCARFHDTMNQVIDTYGETGEVAWVLRQFPLAQLHPNAPRIALASECVAELGGNDAFWVFADGYFAAAPPSPQNANDVVVPELVAAAGVDTVAFENCMSEGVLMSDVEDDFNNAAETGGQGTPWSILIAPNGTTFPINGAQPIGAIEQLIEIARGEV